ncbi:acyl-CoA synthetase (AMP-forming)/AMP-acid ligase II [Mycolicibacterium iranicum]|uniref:Acyl-CoA synthetase (AMP-forming)/AMP-acid ligase II n=1 Tax=Mycolicibacterium iranicum TaxID=912594 RepID=A0A839QED1_MYCIR|nr:class I adenylate-forming enzyme family protein [Mycolicibacterium iranicum]MBB2991612.1 acyl-CoA synthetase (AMP-forming)/AMP-acid ligase II [Mycolicibacterium iranicum]
MSDTIDGLLRARSALQGGKEAVVDPDERITYGDLDAATADLGAAMIAAGIGKGTRVGLLMPNGVSWATIALAAMRVGAILVPLSTLLSPPELAAQLHTASVQHLIAVEEFRGRHFSDGLEPRPPALRTVRTPAEMLALPTASSTAAVGAAMARGVRPADPMAIVFTSGSSGPPKGVLHSHGSAIGAVASGLAARCIGSDTRLYLPMPFFWVGGLAGGLLSALVAGATLVTEPAPQPDSTLRLLAAERVTLFRGWPDQAEALARHLDSSGVDLSHLQPGSLEALLPSRLRSRPGARARLFGMTESFGPYSGYPADTDMPQDAWGSCGKPFDGTQVRIVDPDSGEELPAGEVGMIQLRGPHTLRGICGRTRDEVFTADGYYPTGDLGHLSPQGFPFYHGRCDDMFKVNGATVYPAEVERALRTLPGVRAAYATNVPDGQGNRVGAAVVCDGPLDGADVVDQLRSAARTVLSSFKVPTRWALLADDRAVPRGGTGKVDVVGLRALIDRA